MKPFISKTGSAALAIILVVLGMSPCLQAEENAPKERTIKVTGEGKVNAVPDQAEMEFEVQEEGSKLEDVSAKVSEKMKGVFKAVKSFGILDKDFKTVRFNIQPKMKYANGESQRTGFIVSNRIHVVLKKIDEAGEVLDAVTQAGVAQVDGPNFGFSDPTKIQIEALKAATADAYAKAQALAEASGSVLGKVFSITQTSASRPGRVMGAFSAVKSAASIAVPIATGEDEVTAQVEVVYTLK